MYCALSSTRQKGGLFVFVLLSCYSHQSISDFSWEVYIVHSGVFAGLAYMHEDRTCVGIFKVPGRFARELFRP